MRADAREGDGLCLRPSPTAIGPAAYGHRRQNRQDLSGLDGPWQRRQAVHKGIVPVLRELASQGFRGPALSDLGYRGKRLARIGEALGISVKPVARGRDGKFLPAGICWVVERSFAWLSRYRRLNTIFEPTKEHLVAFIEIAFVSILSRRLKRLVTDELSA
jgi:transposase